MSKISFNNFMMFVKFSMWGKLFREFYLKKTIITVTEDTEEVQDCCLKSLQKLLNPMGEVLQNHIDKIEHTKNKLSFNIYQVIRSSDNQIDFIEHCITSVWRNNKVLQHTHRINKH